MTPQCVATISVTSPATSLHSPMSCWQEDKVAAMRLVSHIAVWLRSAAGVRGAAGCQDKVKRADSITAFNLVPAAPSNCSEAVRRCQHTRLKAAGPHTAAQTEANHDHVLAELPEQHCSCCVNKCQEQQRLIMISALASKTGCMRCWRVCRNNQDCHPWQTSKHKYIFLLSCFDTWSPCCFDTSNISRELWNVQDGEGCQHVDSASNEPQITRTSETYAMKTMLPPDDCLEKFSAVIVIHGNLKALQNPDNSC